MKSPDKKFTVSTAPPLPLVSDWQLMTYWRPLIPLNVAPSMHAIGGEVKVGPGLLISELEVAGPVVVVVVAVVTACPDSDVEADGADVDAACVDPDVQAIALVVDATSIVSELEAIVEEVATVCSDSDVGVVAVVVVVS